MVHNQVLRLPGGITGDRYDNPGRLALDLTGVLLEETMVTVVAGELELLGLIQLACVKHELSHSLRTVQDALHRRTLPGDVVGQVVEPPGVVLSALARGTAALRGS